MVRLEQEEFGEAAVDHRSLLECRLERLRKGGGVDAAARLRDVLARPLLLVRVLGAEEGADGAGVELGQQDPNLGGVLPRMTLVDDVAEELPEIRRAGTGRRLAIERGEQPGTGRDAVAPR
jgi:hypothetical protein